MSEAQSDQFSQPIEQKGTSPEPTRPPARFEGLRTRFDSARREVTDAFAKLRGKGVDIASEEQEMQALYDQLSELSEQTSADLSGIDSGQREQQPGFTTQEEIERAQQGAREFGDIYRKVNRRQRRLLRSESPGTEIQAMFLGAKPVTMFDNNGQRARDYQTLRGVNLPDRFAYIHGESREPLLIDVDLVRQTIQTHREDFDDYRGDYDQASIIDYVTTLAPAERFADFGGSREHQIRVGLLLGYPRDAVIGFVDHASSKRQIIPALNRRVSEINKNVERDMIIPSREQIAMLRYLAGWGQNGAEYRSPQDEATMQPLITRNAAYLALYIKEMLVQYRTAVSPEDISYFIQRIPVDGYEFSFEGTSRDLPFMARVEELRERSGINDITRQKNSTTARRKVIEAMLNTHTELIVPEATGSAEEREASLTQLAELTLERTRNAKAVAPEEYFSYVTGANGKIDSNATNRQIENPTPDFIVRHTDGLAVELRHNMLVGNERMLILESPQGYVLLKVFNGYLYTGWQTFDNFAERGIDDTTQYPEATWMHLVALRRLQGVDGGYGITQLGLTPDGRLLTEEQVLNRNSEVYQHVQNVIFLHQAYELEPERIGNLDRGEVHTEVTSTDIQAITHMIRQGRVNPKMMVQAIAKGKSLSGIGFETEAEYQENLRHMQREYGNGKHKSNSNNQQEKLKELILLMLTRIIR